MPGVFPKKKKIFTATSYQGGQRGPNKDIYKLIKTICKHSKLTKSRLSALKPDGPNALNFQTTRMGKNNQENPNQQGNGQAGRRE